MDKDIGLEKTAFHLPDRQVFEEEKQRYLAENHDATLDDLSSVNLNDEVVERIAETLNRVAFVFEFLKKHIPLLEVPTNVKWQVKFPTDSKSRTVTDPKYSIEGRIISPDELVADLQNDEPVVLEKINIHMNFPYLVRLFEMYERKNVSRDDIDLAEEQDIQQFEAAMVEEWAHALYIQEKSKDPDKLLKFALERRSYSSVIQSDAGEGLLTQEQIEDNFHKTYTDTPIELRAAFWVRAFLEKYYPESRVTEKKAEARRLQKNRFQKQRNRF